MNRTFKKGETSSNGSIYKVDFVEKKEIGIDDEIKKHHELLVSYKETSEKLIKRHNQLIKIREEVATTPDEYLKNGLRTVGIDDLRNLIIKGCDEEISDCNLGLSKITDNFNLKYKMKYH